MSETVTTKTVSKPRILPFALTLVGLFIANTILNPFYFQGIGYIIVTILDGLIFLAQAGFVVVLLVQIIRRMAYHAPKGRRPKKLVKAAKILSLFHKSK